jgi:sugar/nucleoside kinase (ribokinase family)
MANPAFRLHAAGCGLADLIQGDIDFRSERLAPYRSRRPGDGGLEMGKVVLQEDLVRFAGRPWEAILDDLAPSPSAECLAGGPPLVASALASQLLRPSKVPVTYYGLSGDDSASSRLRWLLAQTPLDLTCYRQRPGRTPVTWVFNDPRAQGGHGDRFFIHLPGTVSPDPEILGESFFQATVNLYAGTALTPALHRALPDLLAKGRRRGAFNVVGGGWDPAAEREGRPWTLGGPEAWTVVDLLVANEEEIQRYAAGVGFRAAPGTDAKRGLESAVDALIEAGLASAVATCGPEPAYYRSIGGIFGECRGYVHAHPALAGRIADRASHGGDTTGAGDNFLGGLLASIFRQWLADDFFPKGEEHLERELMHINPPRLRTAVEMGMITGGLACLQRGGLRLEKTRGERLGETERYLPAPARAGRW